MELIKEKRVLVSGASIAGLSTAWWMNESGYKVTVVEMASEPRTAGAAVDFRGNVTDILKRMEIFERLKANRLQVEKMEFKNANDVTEGSVLMNTHSTKETNDDIEIERDKFMNVVYGDIKNKVEFIFNNRITALQETDDNVHVTFADGSQRAFHLVFGCDGMHSGIRRLWFGNEDQYSHFLQAYFSVTIINKLLIEQKTMQAFNVPGKAIMLNAYNGKTDIIFCFVSDKEIRYDYKNTEQQRNIILEQFAGESWRAEELLSELRQSNNFYFDKFCQIKMDSWAKGRVALVGDAGYCASPAAGIGASLSIYGAATIADMLQKHNNNFEVAFQEYEKILRPFINEVQATAEMNVRENFLPRTEEAIYCRNTRMTSF